LPRWERLGGSITSARRSARKGGAWDSGPGRAPPMCAAHACSTSVKRLLRLVAPCTRR